MEETITVLRQAGFFSDLPYKTDTEIAESIYQARKKQYSEMFGYEYDPGRDLSDQQLALADPSKMINWDMEADVGAGNNVYVRLLQSLDRLSGHSGVVKDISEVWESEEGPITLTAKIGGVEKAYRPDYYDDWIDQGCLDQVLADIALATGEKFHICSGPDHSWLGQDANYVRLSDEQRLLLKERLGWSFMDELVDSA